MNHWWLRSRLISVACMNSLGSLRQKPSSFEIILDIFKPPHLPRFQVIENEAFSIRKNVTFYHQSGIDVEEKILFLVESHVLAGEQFESKFLWLKCDSTLCYNFFFFFCFRNVIYHMVRYWFIYSCEKIKRYNACETSPKFSAKNSGICEM